MFFNTLKSIFYTVIGLPVFVFGIFNNYIPYKLPPIIIKRINNEPEYHGSLIMLTGTLTFLFFYGIQISLVQHYFHLITLTLCYAVSLPTTGFFAYLYWKRLNNLRGRWMIFSLFYRKTELITSIITKRQHIIDELEKGRKEYAEMNL